MLSGLFGLNLPYTRAAGLGVDVGVDVGVDLGFDLGLGLGLGCCTSSYTMQNFRQMMHLEISCCSVLRPAFSSS